MPSVAGQLEGLKGAVARHLERFASAGHRWRSIGWRGRNGLQTPFLLSHLVRSGEARWQ
jgi:hypothetical protein